MVAKGYWLGGLQMSEAGQAESACSRHTQLELTRDAQLEARALATGWATLSIHAHLAARARLAEAAALHHWQLACKL